METLTYTRTYATEVCCRKGCGVVWAMDAAFITKRRADHASFYCPNGHAQYYPQESDEEKQRERAERLAARLTHTEDQLKATELSRRAERGHRTRVLNRIQNGVCPHCNRTFADLAAHMKSKHVASAS